MARPHRILFFMAQRKLYILWCILFSLPGMGVIVAQNLIPNPGFEELFTQLEYQWVQPQGPYYHYQAAHPDRQDNPLS